MTDRKATDVLLNIEQMVEKILGHNRNQDLLIKTMLNRVQTLEKKLEATQHPAVPQQDQDFTKNIEDAQPRRINTQLPGLKPSVKIKSNNSQHQQSQDSGFEFPNYQNKQITRDPNDDNDDSNNDDEKIYLESKPQGNRRDLRYIPSTYDGKPVPVQQKILYSDGRAISTAKVEVFDDKSNLVKTLKTNVTGKWTNALPPGKYVIHVSKKVTGTKNSVDAQVEITVPNSSDPVQLKPFQIS